MVETQRAAPQWQRAEQTRAAGMSLSCFLPCSPIAPLLTFRHAFHETSG